MVRTDPARSTVPPGWEAHRVGLEELAMAYLRMSEVIALPGLLVTGGAAALSAMLEGGWLLLLAVLLLAASVWYVRRRATRRLRLRSDSGASGPGAVDAEPRGPETRAGRDAKAHPRTPVVDPAERVIRTLRREAVVRTAFQAPSRAIPSSGLAAR